MVIALGVVADLPIDQQDAAQIVSAGNQLLEGQ